jgi:Tfp pilus assembly protein PilF
MIASFDADNIDVRRALAERYLASGDGISAERWAGECLHINVYDPTIHVLLADAQVTIKKLPQAAEEYQTALSLKPKRPDDVKVKLARALWGAGQKDQARETLEAVLKTDPDHPDGKALKTEMEHGPLERP